MLIEGICPRWTLDVNFIVRLSIDNLGRIVLLRYRLVILDFSLLPLGWRLDHLGLGLSGYRGCGNLFLRLRLALSRSCLLFSLSLAIDDLLLDPGAIVPKLSFEMFDQVIIEGKRLEMFHVLDQAP